MSTLSYHITSSVSSEAYPAINKQSKRQSQNHCIDEFDNPTGNFHEVDYLGYEMPGFVKKVHDRCGEWQTVGCLNVEEHPDKKAFIRSFQWSCDKPRCNTCKKNWLRKAVTRSETRIKRYLKQNPGVVPKHITISPPSWQHHKSLNFLRKQAYKILKEVSCEGGNMVFHAYRSRSLDGKTMWYFSPHFHVIGFGWIVGYKVADVYKKNGWITKNIGVRESFSNVLSYQLSHCAVVKGKHTLTWFGDLGYRNGKLKVENKPKPSKCPECNAVLVELLHNGRGEPPPKGDFEGFVNADSYFAPKKPYVQKVSGSRVI